MTQAQSLAELLAGVEVIDLTQPLSEDTPVLRLLSARNIMVRLECAGLPTYHARLQQLQGERVDTGQSRRAERFVHARSRERDRLHNRVRGSR